MSGRAGCPLCHGAGTLAFEKSGHRNYACEGCGTWFVHPVPPPEALAAFYDAAEETQSSLLCWEGSARHAHATWRRVLREAERRCGRGPLLDVGCGAGQFLSFARECGWTELEGTEVRGAAAALAARRSAARVHTCALEAAPLVPGRFAAITLWDVLEHLPDPRATLCHARELLRPGGMLVLGTPHRHGVSIRWFGPRALLVMPPEHLFLASRAGLYAAAADCGFDVLALATVDVHLRQWTSSGRRSAGGAAGAEEGGAPAERRAAFRTTYDAFTRSRVFEGLQAAANAVLRATRLGDQLLAILRRRS